MSDYNVFIFQYHLFIIGGIESYCYRMLKWAHHKKMRPILIIDYGSKIDNSWIPLFQENEIELFYSKKSRAGYTFFNSNGQTLSFAPNDKIISIASSYESWYRGELLKQVYSRLHFKNILYFFHPYSTHLSKNRWLDKWFSKNILLKLVRNNQVVFMDDQTKLYAINRYGFETLSSTEVIYLGVEIDNQYDSMISEDRYNQKDKMIVTVTRMDFPFKVYVIALIEAFAKLSNEFNIKLTIIGDGPSKNELLNKINAQRDEVKSKINYIGSVSYDKLDNYLRTSYLNVGMGTTILDAAKHGVPSILGIAYCSENICFGEWNQFHNVLGGLINENWSPKEPLIASIKRVLELSKNEYIATCNETYKILELEYGINVIMDKLINHCVDDDKIDLKVLRIRSNIYRYELFIRHFKAKMKKLIFKLRYKKTGE